MKRAYLAFILLFIGYSAFILSAFYLQKPELQVVPFTVDFEEPELTIYDIASYKTGCPEWVLIGLRFAESSYGKNINHPDPYDTGDFGLHEKPSYRSERVEKWGEYNPYCPLDSAIIAGHIIMENYRIMGDMDKAISAYRRGRTGTNRNGIDWQYVNRVKSVQIKNPPRIEEGQTTVGKGV